MTQEVKKWSDSDMIEFAYHLFDGDFIHTITSRKELNDEILKQFEIYKEYKSSIHSPDA